MTTPLSAVVFRLAESIAKPMPVQVGEVEALYAVVPVGDAKALLQVVEATMAYYKAKAANHAADFTGNESEHSAWLDYMEAQRVWIDALQLKAG